jgi:hypothetical protein
LSAFVRHGLPRGHVGARRDKAFGHALQVRDARVHHASDCCAPQIVESQTFEARAPRRHLKFPVRRQVSQPVTVAVEDEGAQRSRSVPALNQRPELIVEGQDPGSPFFAVSMRSRRAPLGQDPPLRGALRRPHADVLDVLERAPNRLMEVRAPIVM